jgi:hypothetical protein
MRESKIKKKKSLENEEEKRNREWMMYERQV